MYKNFCQIKVVTNQNSQLLNDVTFFDILHHYGVRAAFQICSVEKVLCRLTEQIFFWRCSNHFAKQFFWKTDAFLGILVNVFFSHIFFRFFGIIY